MSNTLKAYYKDSSVTIFHGDSKDFVPLLGNFDLLLTDPPYNVAFKGKDV
jgi:DNA modification methylase